MEENFNSLPQPSSSSNVSENFQCRSVNELPYKYREIFSSRFQYFNKIQSLLFDYIFNGDKSLVICAPTASGKTVLLELAIVHELIKLDCSNNPRGCKFYALYLAPLKAIVEEKYLEWQQRFGKFGLKCFSLTGDTEQEDYNLFRNSNYSEVNILLATPEKFDFMIRSYGDSRQLLRLLQLVMIDEIHMLGNKLRGDVLEATITRIKTIRNNANNINIVKILNDNTINSEDNNDHHLRFMAISATAPNVDDISAWLDIKNGLGIRVSSDYRPVKLKKYVFGFEPIKSAVTSEYRFDIQLSYKLEKYIREYSSFKPTLVFCSTRRSVEFTAKILASAHLTYFKSLEQRSKLFYELSKLTANEMNILDKTQQTNFKNLELKLTLASGVAFYHSGLDHFDRRLLEQLFSMSLIPVLVSTSSLAMGVNLPAHLVVIKNTVQYNAGSTIEYDISQILQMIGRAGRPQFDSDAKAIILTKMEKTSNYKLLLNTEKNVESNLFRTLTEQLIMEIVLKTITNVNRAIDWICSTFLFIRIVKNPSFYGSKVVQGDFNGAYPIILNWCQSTMNHLKSLGLIVTIPDNDSSIEPTYLAKIITRHGVSVMTVEKLIQFTKSKYSLDKLLEEICNFKELFQDITIRMNEKKFLNELNKKIRYKLKDRFKTNIMKINCLIQAVFECLNIEPCLNQDCHRIIISGQRVSKCFVEIFYYLFKYPEQNIKFVNSTKIKLQMYLETIVSASRLAQAFRTKMWFDSFYVVKQLPKIGATYSSVLVENGYTSFNKLIDSNPREIEFCIKRNPPFGSFLIDEVKSLPKYNLSLRKLDCNLTFNSEIENCIQSKMQIEFKCLLEYQKQITNSNNIVLKSENHFVLLVIGCIECDQIILLHRINDKSIISSENVLTQQIILIMTKFDAKLTNDQQFSGSNEIKKKDSIENEKKKNSKKKQLKETEEIINYSKMLTDEFLNFIRQLEVSLNQNFLFHCSMRNVHVHTIKAFLISESFAGLDVEEKLVIRFDCENPTAIVSTNNSKENLEDLENKSNETFDDDEDFSDLLLDDYNESFLKNKENYLDNNTSDIENFDFQNYDSPKDLLINEKYNSNLVEAIQSSNPIEEHNELNSKTRSVSINTNLFDKITNYRKKFREFSPSLETRKKYFKLLIPELMKKSNVESTPKYNQNKKITLFDENKLKSTKRTFASLPTFEEPQNKTSKYFSEKNFQ